MITYNKTELKPNRWYEDDNYQFIIFKGYRNSQLATFTVCKFDEKDANWIETEEKRYLSSNEVKHLRECF